MSNERIIRTAAVLAIVFFPVTIVLLLREQFVRKTRDEEWRRTAAKETRERRARTMARETLDRIDRERVRRTYRA